MVDQLQKQFGSSQFKFSEGNGGLTKVAITTAGGEAEVYLHGAHVTHFQPTGQKPVLFMSSTSAFLQNKPIRGGVPVCWPWFGANANDPSLPMHGFARISPWAVESAKRIDDQRASLTLRLEPNDLSRKLWPNDFLARFTVTVGSAIEIELETTNKSSAPIQIAEALHSYFSVGDVEKIEVQGLAGLTYFDKVAGSRSLEDRTTIRLSSETDRVYLNSTGPVTIIDHVLNRKILVEKSGSNATVLWNPFEAKAKTVPDIGPGEWRKYVCVEAVNALDNTVTVAPGTTHKIGTTLKVIG